ncbi:MAG: sulfotransferase, partial [Acidobacteriota bacterium]
MALSEKAPALRGAIKPFVPEPMRAAVRGLLYRKRFHLHPAFSRYLPREGYSILDWLAYELHFHLWRLTVGRGCRLQRPIFMIGSPRSGTWLSVRLFACHPDVANFSEAQEIWDPYHYLDPDSEHHWTAKDVKREDVVRLHARFEHYRRWEGRARFINKHPWSSVRIDYIRAIFPDAVFVHVIRDGRAVAASMVESIRARPHLAHYPMLLERPPNWRELVREDKVEQVALQWRAIVEYILSKRAELGTAYHEFKY